MEKGSLLVHSGSNGWILDTQSQFQQCYTHFLPLNSFQVKVPYFEESKSPKKKRKVSLRCKLPGARGARAWERGRRQSGRQEGRRGKGTKQPLKRENPRTPWFTRTQMKMRGFQMKGMNLIVNKRTPSTWSISSKPRLTSTTRRPLVPPGRGFQSFQGTPTSETPGCSAAVVAPGPWTFGTCKAMTISKPPPAASLSARRPAVRGGIERFF